MTNEARINKINNDLKTYINESKFISNKCRNKIIKLLGEEFNVELDKSAYVEFANVDVQIDIKGNIIVRGESFKSNKHDIDSIEETFNSFKEKADLFLSKKEIDFQSKNIFNNIINLIMVLLIFVIFMIITLIAIGAIVGGNYSFGIWFIVFVLPYVIPNLKDNLKDRFEQAKIFIKRLTKKNK